MFSASSVCEYDIIGFAETWLADSFGSAEYFPDSYRLCIDRIVILTSRGVVAGVVCY